MIILSLLILISYFSPLVSSSSQGDALVQQSYEESMVVSEDVRMLSV